MPKHFYSTASRPGAPLELAFFPAACPAASLAQLMELASSAFPGVPLDRLHVTPGINCFYVSAGEPLREPLEPDPVPAP